MDSEKNSLKNTCQVCGECHEKNGLGHCLAAKIVANNNLKYRVAELENMLIDMVAAGELDDTLVKRAVAIVGGA